MTTFFGTGTRRLIYKARDFDTGLTVTGYIWNPSLAKSSLQTFTEISDGFYYLDWDFSVTGSWFGKFYENGVETINGAWDIVTSTSGGGGDGLLVLWAGEAGNFREDGIVHFYWNSIDKAGDAVSPSTAGSICIYKDDGTSKVTAPTGITDTRNFNGIIGLHECKIDTNANIFYARSKSYNVILEGATIDTVVVNTKLCSFSVEDRFVQEFIR